MDCENVHVSDLHFFVFTLHVFVLCVFHSEETEYWVQV